MTPWLHSLFAIKPRHCGAKSPTHTDKTMSDDAKYVIDDETMTLGQQHAIRDAITALDCLATRLKRKPSTVYENDTDAAFDASEQAAQLRRNFPDLDPLPEIPGKSGGAV